MPTEKKRALILGDRSELVTELTRQLSREYSVVSYQTNHVIDHLNGAFHGFLSDSTNKNKSGLDMLVYISPLYDNAPLQYSALMAPPIMVSKILSQHGKLPVFVPIIHHLPTNNPLHNAANAAIMEYGRSLAVQDPRVGKVRGVKLCEVIKGNELAARYILAHIDQTTGNKFPVIELGANGHTKSQGHAA